MMFEQEIEELTSAHPGCIPVLLRFETTLVNIPIGSVWCEDLVRDAAHLIGKTQDEAEREIKQLLQGVQWRYSALSLLKSLGTDPRFLPIVFSSWLTPFVSIKTRQSHIRPPIFATPLFFDSRKICVGRGELFSSRSLQALVSALDASGRFPRIFFVSEGEESEVKLQNCTTIALGEGLPRSSSVDYVANDLRDAQHILWSAVTGEPPQNAEQKEVLPR
jgi:hypothetical protein